MLFLTIPYILNLYFAVTIKQHIKKTNIIATTYFETKSKAFILLTVFCGGAYAALALISSDIFGLDFFSTGLTKYELGDLIFIKVVSTTLIENFPQLICQILYVMAIGRPSLNFILACTASSLNILASLLTWFLHKGLGNTEPCEFYLEVRIKDKNGESQGNPRRKMTKEEKQHVLESKGLRSKLTSKITEVFQMVPKALEIGSSVMTPYGCIIHCVGYISKSELDDMMQKKLNEKKNSAINGENDEENQEDFFAASINPKFYVSQLFKSHKNTIVAIIEEHFGEPFTFRYSSKWPHTQYKADTVLNLVDNFEQREFERIGVGLDDDILKQSMKKFGYVKEKDDIEEFGRIAAKMNQKDLESELEKLGFSRNNANTNGSATAIELQNLAS